MKVYCQLLALCVMGAWETSAFAPKPINTPSTTVLQSTPQPTSDTFEIFPKHEKMEHIEGGGTVRTYQMPAWATRVQMRFESNGRPMKGEANLWVGPIRKTHTLKFNTESGAEFPIEALLKFKKGPPVLKISTSEDPVCPMKVAVHVPSAERAKELENNTERIWDSLGPDSKQLIQGGGTDGKKGAVRYWNIPDEVESVQFLAWSRDSGKKSFKMDIELLKGPNNIKQKMFLQCGGGSQPYHAVWQTPGEGWTVRMTNKKYVEDGLVQAAVIPYKVGSAQRASQNWNF